MPATPDAPVTTRKTRDAETTEKMRRSFAAARAYMAQTIGSGPKGVPEVAKEHGATRSQTQVAIFLLRNATPSEIALIESDRVSMFTVEKHIHQGHSPEEREKLRATPFSERGANANRLDRVQAESQLWQAFRGVLDGIGSMPKASDLVTLVLANGGRTKAVEDKIQGASQWMKEFENEWRNRRDTSGK